MSGNRKTNSIFCDRVCVFATRHGKEIAVEDIFARAFNLRVETIPDLDTDRFGTFSGEKERAGTPLQAALRKIELAKEIKPEADLFLASEGSFGPHPSIPFLQSNSELLVLRDYRLPSAITAWALTSKIHHYSTTLSDTSDLEQFMVRSDFPNHGIILKAFNALGILVGVEKEATTEDDLRKNLLLFLNSGAVRIDAESDLRAHRNPTRIEAIRNAAEVLATRMAAQCPSCHLPGYCAVSPISGLPCGLCGSQTALPRGERYTCPHCNHSTESYYENKEADPMYCDFCNP